MLSAKSKAKWPQNAADKRSIGREIEIDHILGCPPFQENVVGVAEEAGGGFFPGHGGQGQSAVGEGAMEGCGPKHLCDRHIWFLHLSIYF